jgi:small subunit ribosomal protein S17
MTELKRGIKKERVGTVISDNMQKTVVVEVKRVYQHPLYKKVIKGKTRCYAHDGKGEAHKGDIVRIRECRPLSKTKRWKLVGIVRKMSGTHMEREERESEMRGEDLTAHEEG